MRILGIETISDKKQKLYDKKLASYFVVGEIIVVPEKLVVSWTANKDKNVEAEIIEIDGDNLIVKNKDYSAYKNDILYTIKMTDVVTRNLWNVGANPFATRFDSVRTVAFELSSIIHTLDLTHDRRKEPILMNGVEVKELNWNPYVFNKEGKKEYYQRDFCWSLQDKQLLIESIYNKIDCGKILIRTYSWKYLEKLANNGETELAFKDIVDGKQRMKTIEEFIHNKFPDMHGNYFADLSNEAQYEFSSHQLFSYAEMPESTTDEEVIYQFLKMNFTGVPQSPEHLEFVKEIGKRI